MTCECDPNESRWLPVFGRERTEHYRHGIENLLTRFTEEAESWAASGARMPQEQIARREPARHLRKAA